MVSKLYLFSGIIVFGISAALSYILFSGSSPIPKQEYVSDPRPTETNTEAEISLTATGDISYSRGVEWVIEKEKNINYPFEKIRDHLLGSDIVIGNLETTITEGRMIGYGEMIFRSDPGSELAIKNAGFNILTLANNHIPDFGQKGITDTLTALQSAGIQYTGAGINAREAYSPLHIEIKGIKMAFLAFTDPTIVPASYEAGEYYAGTAFMKTDVMTEKVTEAKEKSDLVIVIMHGGTEYTNKPNDIQTGFARSAIDAGADLIIGHHPHVVQSIETYRGKHIFYSLGNFVFDQMWSRETREGVVLKAGLTKKGLKSFTLLPYIIENYSQPRPANKAESDGILKRIYTSEEQKN